MRKCRLVLMVTLMLAGWAGWFFAEPIKEVWKRTTTAVRLNARPVPKPDPARYAVLSSELERWRTDLAARHKKARTAAERAAVERDARVILELALPEMMRCWLGTPWDFNGTAERPGEGKIACGYFVATVLRDAGFLVDRYKLAQQPSENILRSFLPKDACVLSVGKEYRAFADAVDGEEPGVYVVGLDTHVAFLVVRDGGFRFIHSSGSRPWCVVEEERPAAEVLRRSNWRMLGNLTGNPQVLRRWLKAEKIVVRGT